MIFKSYCVLSELITNNDLLKLLLMVDADAETDIKDIQINLERVSLQEIVCSGVVDKRQCVL